MKLLPFGRASFMLDVVSVAMVLVLPLLAYSVQLAKRGRYVAHMRIQTVTAVTLLVAVLAFEVDIRLNGWRQLATPSPYYDSWLFPLLYVHLCFAVTTTVLWGYTVITALRAMGGAPGPSPARAGNHRRFGWATALFTGATSLTGWTFYWMAFVAE